MAEYRTDIDLDLPTDEVWDLVVDDDERADWFGGPTTLEPEPGSAATFTDPDGTERHAIVTDVDEHRRIGWTWWTDAESVSQVTIELEPRPGGRTRLTVVESTAGAAGGPRATARLHRCASAHRALALA